METIKQGDKLYLVTRRDIAPGYQAVQACHALRQFVSEHSECDKNWFNNSNYIAFLSVANDIELMTLIEKIRINGLRFSIFNEPDLNDQITAIAIEPHYKTVNLCKSLPLALKEY